MEQKIGRENLKLRLLALAGGLLTVLLFFASAVLLVVPAPWEVERVLDAQLGGLVREVTPGERRQAEALLWQLLPLQNLRQRMDLYPYLGPEELLLQELNDLYEELTDRYLGPVEEEEYSSPREQILARFIIQPEDYDIAWDDSGRRRKGETTDTEELARYQALWKQVRRVLPAESLAPFGYFLIWTDGEGETLAYVRCLDEEGHEWELAVDPADADDEEELVATVIHEYAHYLTLNGDQVQYTKHQTASTYNEWGMVSEEDSYLNRYYQRFWRPILDDCLINPGSYGFYLRHREEFVSSYASTDPSEDICESFSVFVLSEEPRGESIAEQKVRFFYEFEELVALRQAIRDNLALSQSAAGG